jgi:16S rRNA (guanine(966)-N(2))-methyltransferase RsmD
MIILKGSLKGIRIGCPPHIRPVALMVKKACFDIFKEEIQGKRVLDLFAGSGSLGIEALSNGAKEAIFVDIRGDCVETIKKNVFLCKISPKTKIYLKDAFGAIKGFATHGEAFDLIFLDPPYHRGMLRKALQTLEEYDILTPLNYIVSLCSNKDDFVRNSKVFSLIVEKKYGQTLLLIYRKI